VVATEGFNPDKVKSLKEGMEHPLGRTILCGVILDRDYRSEAECDEIQFGLEKISEFCRIHRSKEIENFVLIPSAIERSIKRRIIERQKRGGKVKNFSHDIGDMLDDFCADRKSYILSQFTERYKAHERKVRSAHEATLIQEAVDEFEKRWANASERLKLVPGKEALAWLNSKVQPIYKVSITAGGIVDAMHVDEIPLEMKELIDQIGSFASTPPPV